MKDRMYRGYRVVHNPKPIPIRAYDWDFWPEDYDGSEDGRGGSVHSLEAALARVDEELANE